MKMFKDLKEDINKSINENINKQYEEMKKIVQDMNEEIES